MRPKLFYGYVILALCFINMVVMRGVNGAFGVYYIALLESFSWSHSDGATVASVNFLVYALAAPLVGLGFDRFGPRVLMPLGGALVAAGMLASSFAGSLWHLYVSYGVMTALGQGALGFVGHNALISRWFVRRRATAIGIAAMGQGLGALAMVPMTQFLIGRIGWRSTFALSAGLILLAIVVPNALLQRRSPQEVGQSPDGDSPSSEAAGRAAHRAGRGRDWTLGEAFRSYPFWCITVGHLALGTALFMINTHIVAHFVSAGFDKLFAAFLAGLIGFVRIGGTVTWGTVSDLLGRDRAYGIATLVVIAGILCLIAVSADSPLWFVYLAAVIYSIGHSAGNPTYGAVIGDIFSGPKVGLIFGFLEISFGLGSSAGAWLGGYLFDLTGSYAWPLSLCVLCFSISGLSIHACLRWQARNAARPLEAAAAL
ncbi:MAG TPA: MFS transporter [candidate division Zixibacteria bacterium]|nr:MFS transporter [candidate division Zixibacteria bacterium]